MKNNLFLIALLAVAITSCHKDEPTPEPTPTPEPPPTLVTYDDFMVNADQKMDSVIFTNVTKSKTEHITAVVTKVTCQGIENNLSKFHLANKPSKGDQISVKVYHNDFTWGGLPIIRFLANSSTVICDVAGGHIVQTSNGNSTTMTFTAN